MKRGTPEHPKTEMLASLLGIPVAHAVGLLEMLWHFTAKFSPDGDLSRWDESVIAKKSGWDGDAHKFIEALCNANGGIGGCAFLERTANALCVHDWPEHCDDAVHMLLARAGRPFADGSIPRLTRLSKDERSKVEALYRQRLIDKNAQNTHATRTTNAQQTHCPPPPSPAPPSPAVILIPPPTVPDGFDRFWSAWPKHFRKTGRSKCRQFWKQRKLEPLSSQIVNSVERWKKCDQWTKDAGQFIPGPIVWLRDERWENENVMGTDTDAAQWKQGPLDDAELDALGWDKDQYHDQLRKEGKLP